jgi:AbrB family looped-hinge helix DNA binding protein
VGLFVRMSSKGQLVIPRAVRRALKLSPGARLQLEVVENKIILQPVIDTANIDALYGTFADYDLLADHEAEHRAEVERDRAVRS